MDTSACGRERKNKRKEGFIIIKDRRCKNNKKERDKLRKKFESSIFKS